MSVRSYLLDAFYSLGANINKRRGEENQENSEGIIGPRLPELTLKKTNDDLVKLSDSWEKSWNDSNVKTKWEKDGDENEKYWKGDHYDRPELDKSRSVKDNAIFEGLETYLPQVTRRNPDAMVELAVSELEGSDPAQNPDDFKAKQAYAHALQAELAEIADDMKIRLKLKGVARHWSIRLVGAVMMNWDVDKNQPTAKVLRPINLILDPDATVDEDGYSGDRAGLHRKLSAGKILDFLEKNGPEEGAVDYINGLANGEMATSIGFIEWWTPDYMFWKCDSQILLKKKNPHWNYDEEMPEAPKDDVTTAENAQPVPVASADQGSAPEGHVELPEGAPAVPQLPQAEAAPEAPDGPRKGVNHFKKRKIPILLLSIYNLGKQPVDMTSLMGQNLANQDLINKRIRQIDRNADTANNGMVVSLERSGLNKDQAARVSTVIRNGGVVAIPSGSPQEAIYKPVNNELPAYIYNQLVDVRNRVRDIWGLRGSSPAGLESDTTVRGKIMNKTADTDRIGGGISEYLEQFADDMYNWIVQLLYVYDDRFQEQMAKGIPLPVVKVSVKEGSLLPKDTTTLANQAMQLASEGKMASIDLYKALDYPNPEELGANAWLEVNAPEVLYANDKRVAQVVQMKQQQAQAAAAPPPEPKKVPSVSINFKDLPPDGQAQAAAEAGITLHPEGIAAHAAMKSAQDMPLPSPADLANPTP